VTAVSTVRLAAMLVALVALAGCGGSKGGGSSNGAAPTPKHGAAPWPAPSDPLTRTRSAGLVPEPAEQLAYHVHSHLDVYVNGKHELVPAGIGIEISDPAVHTFRARDGSVGYGGIYPPCALPCISPLHTHFDDGVLHTESSSSANQNDLAQFFAEWGVKLTSSCVGGYCKPKSPIAIYVNGKVHSGDPGKILLSNLKEIAIVIGTPPKAIPQAFPQ
jgi:hypothetical protein